MLAPPVSCSRSSLLISLLLWIIHLTTLDAQAAGDKPSQGLCSSLSLHANATGEEDSAYYSSFSGSNDLGRWRVTVESKYQADNIETVTPNATEEAANAVANLWLDPWTTVNLNDGSNIFSACAFVFKGLPKNTIERGQVDDTTCEQTLSKACTDELTKRAANAAQWLVANPTLGPYSNLTPPILDPICSEISQAFGTANSINDKFPDECRPYFDDGTKFFPYFDRFTLTDNVSHPTNCSFYPGQNRRGYEDIIGGVSPPGIRYEFNGTSPAQAYDQLVQQVYPIMTIIMPPANNSRLGSINPARGVMSCIRARNITASNRIPAALPAPAPVHFPGQLSKGAIAGIVIGSVIGAAILVGAGWLFWRRNKKRKNNHAVLPEADEELIKSSQLGGAEVHQLTSKEKAVSQLHGNHTAEMEANAAPGELQSDHKSPVELPGSDLPVPRK